MTNHILKHEGKALINLLQKVDKLREFDYLLSQYLEASIVAHCKVANLQNNTLIVIADNGSWATQFRFQVPDLLEKLRQHPDLHGLKAISCKTRPDHTLTHKRKKNRTTPMKGLSKANAQMILDSAEAIDDKRLREIMQRIAKREI